MGSERLRSAAWFLSVLFACALTLALVAAMCVVAQRTAGVPPGLATIRMREKRFGHSLRFSPSSGSEGTETTEEAMDWVPEGAEAHRQWKVAETNERKRRTEEEAEEKAERLIGGGAKGGEKPILCKKQ